MVSGARGNPLDRSELGEIRFTIAALKGGERGETSYHNYVLSQVAGGDYVYKGEKRRPAVGETRQPHYDRAGPFARLKPGVYTYTFKTALPESYDKKATHVVGGELTRENRRHVANPLFEFVPGGGKVQVRWAGVETASCNQCHDPLKAHGGLRREVGYCVLCHTPQLTDPETGHSLEFQVLVHKIHGGKKIPSVKEGKPLFVVGNRQRVFDFSTVGFPQDLRNCQTCHGASQKTDWMNRPAISSCTSCHDNVDLKTGKNHGPGPQPEGSCVGCHQAQGPEFGLSVRGAHTAPHRSAQLPGVAFEILRVEGGRPGQNPVVTFGIKNSKGEPVDASRMDNLRLVLAWPTTDYRLSVEEDARKAQAIGSGIYSYRFAYAMPPESKGSGAIAIQGYKNVDLKRADGRVISEVRDVGFNAVTYFPITDKEPLPRRAVVGTQKCNGCHETLAAHGEARRNAEYCVMCHNSSQTDEIKRKTAKGPVPPVDVHFKVLIHKIHTGEELGEPFIVYGGPPAKPVPIDFGEVRFPGDRRNCAKCHEKGTYEIPLPPGVLPTVVPQLEGGPKVIPPVTAACTGCHTNEAAQAHVETQVASGGKESCAVCHAVGREFSVTQAHRR